MNSAGVVCVVLACLLSFVAPHASAAPYPPVPPTNGVLVPASAQVQAPMVDPVRIAPGSFPVQARTGSPVAEDSASSVLIPAAATTLALVTLILGLMTVRRIRVRSLSR